MFVALAVLGLSSGYVLPLSPLCPYDCVLAARNVGTEAAQWVTLCRESSWRW